MFSINSISSDLFLRSTFTACAFSQPLLCFPSFFEGWGLPVTEAFHAGLPVASSNASCLAETSSGAALLFAPSDVEEMADALDRVMTDAVLRAHLVQRGHEVAARLKWRETATRFRQLHMRLVQRSALPPSH